MSLSNIASAILWSSKRPVIMLSRNLWTHSSSLLFILLSMLTKSSVQVSKVSRTSRWTRDLTPSSISSAASTDVTRSSNSSQKSLVSVCSTKHLSRGSTKNFSFRSSRLSVVPIKLTKWLRCSRISRSAERCKTSLTSIFKDPTWSKASSLAERSSRMEHGLKWTNQIVTFHVN